MQGRCIPGSSGAQPRPSSLTIFPDVQAPSLDDWGKVEGMLVIVKGVDTSATATYSALANLNQHGVQWYDHILANLEVLFFIHWVRHGL